MLQFGQMGVHMSYSPLTGISTSLEDAPTGDVAEVWPADSPLTDRQCNLPGNKDAVSNEQLSYGRWDVKSVGQCDHRQRIA